MKASCLCIVLHYGSVVDTAACLESIVAIPQLDIVVADNDSSQSYEIPIAFQERVKLFRTGGNLGFAAANNLAVKHARKNVHRHVLLLNNDTLVIGDAVDRLLSHFKNDTIGIVGPCMPYASHPEDVWACGGYINRVRLSVGGYKKRFAEVPKDVAYLPGAALITSSHIWDSVGGLPERYFLAYEEAEFAIRIQRAGYRAVVDSLATIYHHVGMSSDPSPKYYYNSIRNRIRFSQFLYRKVPGFIWGVFLTFLQSSRRNKSKIWLYAVFDEITGTPLNHGALNAIETKFKTDFKLNYRSQAQ